MKRIPNSKTVVVLCWVCAVIFVVKPLVFLAVCPTHRDWIDWTVDIVCAVVWLIAAAVNTVRWKRGN